LIIVFFINEEVKMMAFMNILEGKRKKLEFVKKPKNPLVKIKILRNTLLD